MTEHDLWSIAFPTLEDRHVEELAACMSARSRHCRDGEVLIEVGAREFGFFVVREGSIEILDVTGDAPNALVTHRRGQFTGDVSHVTGAPALVRALARGATVVDEMDSASVRRLINQCPDVGDVVLQAFLARRQLLSAPGAFTGLRVIGSRYSQDTFRVREFLARNHVLFTWLDLETDPAVAALLEHFGVTAADTPVVACARKMMLRNPSNRALAEEIGLLRAAEDTLYDLAIVGSGPAGLAAAVYGASEGLNTILLEKAAPGGQAGGSMRIENYLGFPAGITGGELTDRAVLQASKFGARITVPARVTGLGFKSAYPVLDLDAGAPVVAKCLLIATGADYRRLPVDDCPRFEGRGVYYAATPHEARGCRDADVIVVGGGNSAGQAAVFLAGHARRVLLVVRGSDLHDGMSSYLARRIEDTEGVDVRTNCVVAGLRGHDFLAEVDLRDTRSGEVSTVSTQNLFSFIGAIPRTEWLPPEILTDERGFVLTGSAVRDSDGQYARREPHLLETSRRGVFAAGDVRSGSIKRCASAVGEGSMAIQFVHEVLKER